MPDTPATTRKPRRATPEDANARILLDRLVRSIDAEIDRRRAEADLEPAGSTPVDIAALSNIAADLPNLARLGIRALRGMTPARAASVVSAGMTMLREQRALAERGARGEERTDEFGFDPEWTETLLPLVRWVYRDWWRVQVRGIHNIPAEGRALLVSNHAGVVPYDGAMIRMAVLEEHPVPRHVRALVLNGLFGTPFASWLVRRTGNTLADPRDAERLLTRDELVLVFPEGSKGPGKLYRDRYRLQRFGRGGFVEVARRTDSPIVPISIVGSEEIHPMLADIEPLARALGQPYVPVTPTLPLLGPLGAVPLPSSWIIEFHAPIPMRGRAADQATVLEVSDHVRDVIQAGVYANLERRGSVFAPSS